MLKEPTVMDKIIPATASIKQKLSEIEKVVRCELSSDAYVRIKNSTVLGDLVRVTWHEKLIDVISWLHNKLPGCILITSGFRANSAIHGTNPLRAVDLRSTVFPEPFKVCDYINDNWLYGDGTHKVCLFHRVMICKSCKTKHEVNPLTVPDSLLCATCGKSEFEDLGPHFHIQVSTNTKMRV